MAAGVVPALLTSAVWVTSAQSAPPEDVPPAEQAADLDCGGGMVIVYHADWYVTKDDEQAAAAPSDPDEAVAELVAEVYPGAARERAFQRVPGHAQARYEAVSSRGHRAAVLTVAEQDGQYYVEDVAICENLAARWAR